MKQLYSNKDILKKQQHGDTTIHPLAWLRIKSHNVKIDEDVEQLEVSSHTLLVKGYSHFSK